MEEPRELTVEEIEAQEIGELPPRELLSLVRPDASHPLPHFPDLQPGDRPGVPLPDTGVGEQSDPSDPQWTSGR